MDYFLASLPRPPIPAPLLYLMVAVGAGIILPLGSLDGTPKVKIIASDVGDAMIHLLKFHRGYP